MLLRRDGGRDAPACELLARCCYYARDPYLIESVTPGRVVDGVNLVAGDRVFLFVEPSGPCGLYTIAADGAAAVPCVFRSLTGAPLPTAPVFAAGTVVRVLEGAAYADAVFRCVDPAAGRFERGGGEVDPNAAAPMSARADPVSARAAAVLGIDDLIDAATLTAGPPPPGVLILGSTLGESIGAIGAGNVCIGTTAGLDLGPSAINNTIVGVHRGAADAIGRVVIANGAGDAALACVPGRKATWVGPNAGSLFSQSAQVPDASFDGTTWIGGAVAADFDVAGGTAAVHANAVVLADGAGDAALAALPTSNSVWVGPGCKRLLRRNPVPVDSVWFGGTGDQVPESNAALANTVVVADGAGNATLCVHATRRCVWFGPRARRLLTDVPVAPCNDVVVVGAVSAVDAAAAVAGEVLLADGAGTVRLRARNRTVHLAPANPLSDAPTAPADNCTFLGAVPLPAAGTARTHEVAVATTNPAAGALCALFADARRNVALGPAAAVVAARARANDGTWIDHTVLGAVPPPEKDPNRDPATAPPAAAAVVLSTGADHTVKGDGLVLYADPHRAWIGTATHNYGSAVPLVVPPATPALRGTENPTTTFGVARHGVWIGHSGTHNPALTPEQEASLAGSLTLADPKTGDVQWHCDHRGHVSWSHGPVESTDNATAASLAAVPSLRKGAVSAPCVALVVLADADGRKYAALRARRDAATLVVRPLGRLWPLLARAGLRPTDRDWVWDASVAGTVLDATGKSSATTAAAPVCWVEASSNPADRVVPATTPPRAYNSLAVPDALAGVVTWAQADDMKLHGLRFPAGASTACFIHPYADFHANVLGAGANGAWSTQNRHAPPQLCECTVLVAMRPETADTTTLGDTVLTVLSKGSPPPSATTTPDAAFVLPAQRYGVVLQMVVTRTTPGDSGTARPQITATRDSGRHALVLRATGAGRPAAAFMAVAYRIEWNRLSLATESDTVLQTVEVTADQVLYAPTTADPADAAARELAFADGNRHSLCLGARLDRNDPTNGDIAAASGTTADHFHGYIGEVCIVPRALSDAEVVVRLEALRAKWCNTVLVRASGGGGGDEVNAKRQRV